MGDVCAMSAAGVGAGGPLVHGLAGGLPRLPPAQVGTRLLRSESVALICHLCPFLRASCSGFAPACGHQTVIVVCSHGALALCQTLYLDSCLRGFRVIILRRFWVVVVCTMYYKLGVWRRCVIEAYVVQLGG